MSDPNGVKGFAENRPATADDARTLATLRYRFRSEFGTVIEEEAAFVTRAAEWMAARLGDHGAWRVWVAQDVAECIVGHVFLQFIEKIPNPVPEQETHAYVTNLYVVPEARSKGIGTLLLQTALAACTEVNVDSVILWPSDASVPLYQRHGFTTPAALLELRG